MVVGYNLFSFDLFGLGRRASGSKRFEKELLTEPHKAQEPDSPERQDDKPENDLFFWGLYPVF